MTREELRQAMIEAAAVAFEKRWPSNVAVCLRNNDRSWLGAEGALTAIDALLDAFPIFYANNAEVEKLAREAAAKALEDAGCIDAAREIRTGYTEHFSATKAFNATLPFIERQERDTLENALRLIDEINAISDSDSFSICRDAACIERQQECLATCKVTTRSILAMLERHLADITPKPIPTKEEAAKAYAADPTSPDVKRYFAGK